MEHVYRSYYTKSEPIVDYMTMMLHLEDGQRLLEPCAGDGVFIDSILATGKSVSIDAYEINPQAIAALSHKYAGLDSVRIHFEDTLVSESLTFASGFGGLYDRIIANPPYGGWQDYDKRKFLKERFAGLYARETYSLFLYRAIELLKPDGLLSFIVPDTFLHLHMHKRLRETLLLKTKILEVLQFPSSFFPGVNFGYAKLSIITLQRSTNSSACKGNRVVFHKDFKAAEEISGVRSNTVQSFEATQETLYKNIDHTFFFSNDSTLERLINAATTRIGDIASCVTGFYSGNDKRFLRPVSEAVKNSKGYELLDPSQVCTDYLSQSDILSGLLGPRKFVPIVKGGAVKYIKPNNWYVDWSRDSIFHYRTDSKARFQNSQFYFKLGIGVPMVSSSRISAALLDHKVFDQSIVGIFAKDESLIYYLLALFNSPTYNKLIRTINPSANNPANYIKKIPFLAPSKYELQHINDNVTRLLAELEGSGTVNSDIEEDTNGIIERLYGV